MKKLNKKGFTIVELVIVIAVIAILAAVLIPTFSNVIKKANQSSALQACRNELIEVKATYAMAGGDVPEGTIFVSGDYAFKYTNGELEECKKPTGKYEVKLSNVSVISDLKVEKATQTDAKCPWCGKVHAISLTLPEGKTISTTENSSYVIKNSANQVVAQETFKVETTGKTTVYFNIATCQNDGSQQYDNLTNAAAVGSDYYTYTYTAGGNTYTGVFYFAD